MKMFLAMIIGVGAVALIGGSFLFGYSVITDDADMKIRGAFVSTVGTVITACGLIGELAVLGELGLRFAN